MKLNVANGDLTLPSDFSFEVEQNSAFFSEDGASSIPATIPATPSDQAKLGYPTRLGRKNRFVNSFPAILQHGVFQKQGVLVVATADDTSITCSLAVEDSEFYTQYKDKNLKDIFATMVLRTYNTPSAWYNYLFTVYKEQTICDFRVFPVAVNYNEEKGTYQLNNEPLMQTGELYETIWPLAHEVRVVEEGNDQISVPDGYGIAPYLKLYKFFELIFTLCGYIVTDNCFQTNSKLSSLVLLHNCADVICNGKIDYSDLVPKKTISEILEWMKNKFHAQIKVSPISKEVQIVLLEDVLATGFDIDLTGKVIGSPQYAYSSSSRVVMTPDTSLDGALPAAETIQSLVKKYGTVLPVNESQFSQLQTPCLCLRLATGNYYEVHVSFVNYASRRSGVAYKKVLIGSNQFKYDRANADGAEEFSPEDLVAPMVATSYGIIAPYVGERCHRNTSYNDSGKDEDQEIIIADYLGLTEGVVYEYSGEGHARVPYTADGKYYMASTQPYNNRGNLVQGKIAITPEAYVPAFFGKYNKHLRNNVIEVSGEFNLTIEQLMNFNMYNMKLFDGQKLLPTYLKYEVGKRIRCTAAKFKLFKDFADGEEDSPITVPQPAYQWQLNQSVIESKVAQLQAQQQEGTVGWKYDDSDPYIDDDSKDIFLLSPRTLGESTARIDRVIYFYKTIMQRKPVYIYLETDTLPEWFDSVEIP